MRLARALLIVLCTATGCARKQVTPATNTDPNPNGSTIVVRRSELAGGSLLSGLKSRVPSMTIVTRSGECPGISFRGPRSFANGGNPSVYVDGTLMGDTCILNQISVNDIDRVEMSPNGNSPRPGVQRNPAGLILIFRAR